MEFTGERYTPEVGGGVRYEHLHRYAISLQHVQGKQVLDLASGEGYGSYHLSKVAVSVVGVDIDEAAVSHAKQRYAQQLNLSYHVGNCTQIPLDDRSVDVVVSFETIEHHDQHEMMMCEIKRVLRPDGLLIISSPNKKTYSEDLGNHNHFHIKELYLEEFNDLLAASFSQVKLYGQKLLTGSVITPLEQSKLSGLDLCVGVSIENEIDFRQSCEGLGGAIYFIALCSDSPLPTLQPTQTELGSYYLEPDNDIWNEMGKSLNETYVELHQKNLNLYQSNTESHELRVQLHEAAIQIHQFQQDLHLSRHDCQKFRQDLHQRQQDLHQCQQDLHQSRLDLHESRLGLHESRLNLYQSQQDLHESRIALHQSRLELHQSQQDAYQSKLELSRSQEQLDELNASKFVKVRSYWQKLNGRA